MDDDDEKSQLPVHPILGANNFAKICSGERLILLSQCYAQMKISFPGLIFAQYKSINIIIIIILLLHVGCRGDPVAEFMRFGWALMSPGAETDLSSVYLAINSTADYKPLCTLDILGLADTPMGDQGDVYDEFKEHLCCSLEGWYETALPWKGNHLPLPNNYEGSIHHLNTLVCKLRQTDMLSEYDAVISEQLEHGVVE